MTLKPKILIDQREKVPLRFSSEVETETVFLETGDYSVAGWTHHVAIERKAPGDLWSCCGHERQRFETELARLQAYPVRAVVIEANQQSILAMMPRGRVQPATVIRSAIGWQQDFAVPFVWAGDPTATSSTPNDRSD